MKFFFLLFSLFTSTLSFAEVYRCSFTEPFISIVYNSDENLVTRQEMGSNEVVLARNAKFILSSGQLDQLDSEYLVQNSSGKTILKMKYTNNGSDGMSDFRYPYDVWYEGQQGACFTNSRPVQNF